MFLRLNIVVVDHMHLSRKLNLVIVKTQGRPQCLFDNFFLVLDCMQERLIISDFSHGRKLKTIYLYFHK